MHSLKVGNSVTISKRQIIISVFFDKTMTAEGYRKNILNVYIDRNLLGFAEFYNFL